MEERAKACCFIGHRKIEETPLLRTRLKAVIENLILSCGVTKFLFGSRSEFDDLCHDIVTELQQIYPKIERIAYTCRSEYAVMKEEKVELERIASRCLKEAVTFKDFDGKIALDRVYYAGNWAYIARNEAMIDASAYCIFYYDKSVQLKKNVKSGTKIAYEYAVRKNKKIFNFTEEQNGN